MLALGCNRRDSRRGCDRMRVMRVFVHPAWRIAARVLAPAMGAVVAFAATAPVARAQFKAGSEVAAIAAKGFEPLDKWKAAVMAGDKGALAAMYSSMQGAYTQTPRGRVADPNEEPEFWTKLRASGLRELNPKILQASEPQPGVMVLTLRIDVTVEQGGKPIQALISGAQIWVQQASGWYIYRTQRSDLLPRPAMRLPEPARPNPQLYPEPSAAHTELDAALAAAKKDGKRVLVVFGANWCYDCHVLDATFRSKTIQPLVTAGYHVVHVNVGDGSENTDLARRCEVPSDRLPSLAVLDATGRLVTSQKNGEFDNAVKIGMGDVSAFLKQWAPAHGG
jgi:thioredoxin 1